jgi:molybdopterin molybdotransferase
MLSLEEARQRILARLPSPVAETVGVQEAAGRVPLTEATARVALPPFDNSAMDGYALRAEDAANVTADQPVALRVIGTVAAGGWFDGEVTSGTCVRLFTGSPLPRGADAVIMQEDTRPDPGNSQGVLILDRVRPWENVRFLGEDVKAGAQLFAPGTRLNAAQAGLLAATGTERVLVARRPVVGLLATGDELREPGQPLSPGQIYESNRATLAALVSQAGALPKTYPLVPDNLVATTSALETALSECDAVVTSGGASVGEHDFVKSALGGALEFWRVAVKPGKPFIFGVTGGKPVFGLPGNPVSAIVTFLLLVRPALLAMQGDAAPALPALPGELVEPLVNKGDRRHFMRMRLDAEGRVWPAGLQASHALGSLAAANGLVDVPPETTLPAGARVKVLQWN